VVKKKREINWRTDVKYDVVQFDLSNPTSSDVEIDLFDSDNLTATQTDPDIFAPVANQSQLSVSGSSPVLQGMGFLPSSNYLFMTDPTGERVIWDLTNNIQVSQYNVGIAISITGNIIERPSTGRLYSGFTGSPTLMEHNWQAMTQTPIGVTATILPNGVYYDSVTDTLYFGYVGLNVMGSYHLPTGTLTDIATPLTNNSSITIDETNRKLYATGASVSGAIITEIDLDSHAVTTYDYNFTGLTGLIEVVVDPDTGRLFGAGTDGLVNYVGEFVLSPIAFNSVITGGIFVFGRFVNMVITKNTLFVYDTL
jgi:hypothetical protein